MKTLEEVYHWVATESGYNNKEAMFTTIAGDKDVVEFYMRLVAITYAEQAIEEYHKRINDDLDANNELQISDNILEYLKEELK